VRVLVTGLSTYWGGRAAHELEQRPDVEVVVGVDTRDPRIQLERTEFVRTDSTYSILARIVNAAQIDTILHTHLIVDSTRASSRRLHEINVIGTMSLLAAAGASGSPVRKVVLKSSGLVYGAAKSDPYFFREDMNRTSAPSTNVERSLLEVEAFLRDFADDSPHVNVTLLRFANVLGDDLDTPFALALRRPVVPEVLGFDPRVQFVHEDDVVGALMYATNNDVPGVYNVAAEGWLSRDELRALVGRKVQPSVGPEVMERALRRLFSAGLVDVPPSEVPYLVHPWVVAIDRLKAEGWNPQHTNEETVLACLRGREPTSAWKAAVAAAGGATLATTGLVVAALLRRRRRRSGETSTQS